MNYLNFCKANSFVEFLFSQDYTKKKLYSYKFIKSEKPKIILRLIYYIIRSTKEMLLQIYKLLYIILTI